MTLEMFPGFFSDNNSQSQDTREVPLKVADKWGFPLQHYENPDGYLYAVQDWIAGLTGDGLQKSAKAWSNMQNQTVFSKVSLDYVASDGKTYQRDFIGEESLYQVAQQLRATKARPQLKEIRDFLARSGKLVSDLLNKPEIAQQVTDELTTRHNLIRGKGKANRNQLTATAQQTHVTHTPNYGALTNTEYQELFGAAKDELCRVLDLTPTQSNKFRDYISDLALTALDMAETGATIKMRQLNRLLTTPEQITIVRQMARLVAPGVQAMAHELKVDLLTGKPLLAGKTQ